MPTVLLCVDGMSGPSDEDRLEEALRSQPGVLGAVASHVDHCAEVDCDDDEIDLDRLIDVVQSSGFQGELGG